MALKRQLLSVEALRVLAAAGLVSFHGIVLLPGSRAMPEESKPNRTTALAKRRMAVLNALIPVHLNIICET